MEERLDLTTLKIPTVPFSDQEKLFWAQELSEIKEQLERLEERVQQQRANLSQSAQYAQRKGMTWSEVGNALGVSRERARQIAGK